MSTKYSELYVELWEEECVVCLETKDFFFRNKCQCTGLVCQDCIVRCTVKEKYSSKVNIRCPLCRLETAMVKVYYWRYSFEKREADKAKKNWNFWFRRLSCIDKLRPFLTTELFNNDAIHYLLRTGRFDDPSGAGVCVDKQAAKKYLLNQINIFMKQNGL